MATFRLQRHLATFRRRLRSLPIPVTDAMRDRCSLWTRVLSATAGVACTVLSGLAGGLPAPSCPATSPPMFMYTDAAKEGTDTPSLGGYMHGSWWSSPQPLKTSVLTY